MNRLDRAVIIAVFVLVGLVALGRHSIVYDPGAGRRPQALPELVPFDNTAPPPRALPPGQTVTPPQPPSAQASPPRVRRPLLAPLSAQDPLFEVEPDEVKSGSLLLGTAFSVDQRGVWVTARHVASNLCRQLAIFTDGRPIATSIAYVDPEMDVAVLTTHGGAPALPLESATPTVGETGYSFGYPTGVLGATQDTLMGRSRMQGSGRLSGITPTLSWAEARRIPESLDSLGGMSGGPMLDESGRVVGSVVAASERRGRVHTVAPEVLSKTGQTTRLFGTSTPSTPVQEIADRSETLGDVASDLSDGSRIAKVYCRAR
jgi:serine protease Do